MSLICRERPKQTGKTDIRQPGSVRDFWVYGTSDKLTALLTVGATAPAFDSSVDLSGNPITLFRNQIEIDEAGGGAWNARVNYSTTANTVELNFTFGVQSAKIYQGLKTVRVYDCAVGGSYVPLRGVVWNAANENPINISSPAHGLGNNQIINIAGVVGNTAANGRFTATFVDGDNFTLSVVGGAGVAGNGAYGGGGYWTLEPPTRSGHQIFDFRGGIGFDGEKLEGVEIEVGKVEFSLPKKMTLASIPGAYFLLLSDFTDRTAVNQDDWTFLWMGQQLILPAGSLRFRGAPIKWTSANEVEITYNFAYSRNIAPVALWDSDRQYIAGDVATIGRRDYRALRNNHNVRPPNNAADWFYIGANENLYIGGSEAIDKEGHQYLWTYYRQIAAAGAVAPVPDSAAVEQVYPYRDFTQLLI